jgi:hypothetical protein
MHHISWNRHQTFTEYRLFFENVVLLSLAGIYYKVYFCCYENGCLISTFCQLDIILLMNVVECLQVKLMIIILSLYRSNTILTLKKRFNFPTQCCKFVNSFNNSKHCIIHKRLQFHVCNYLTRVFAITDKMVWCSRAKI